MQIKYSKKSLKFLSGLDQTTVRRIRAAIDGLTKSPPVGDIKRMQGCGDGRSRLRVGKWRIVYRHEHEDGILFIIDIGSRGDIYK